MVDLKTFFSLAQGSAQEYLSGGLNCNGVCYIRVYFKWISEKCKNDGGQISEGGGWILTNWAIAYQCGKNPANQSCLDVTK